jgi:hypothetical protein
MTRGRMSVAVSLYQKPAKGFKNFPIGGIMPNLEFRTKKITRETMNSRVALAYRIF